MQCNDIHCLMCRLIMDSLYVIFYSSPFFAESNQGSDCTKQQIWIWLSAMIRGQREHDTTAPAKAPGELPSTWGLIIGLRLQFSSYLIA